MKNQISQLLNINTDDLNKEYKGKKELYQYFGIKNEKEILRSLQLTMMLGGIKYSIRINWGM